MPIRPALTAVLVALAGCAGTPEDAPSAISVPRYATAFDAAKSTLRDKGFILERVDAAAGVITTQPKNTAGIATPWHSEQASFAQELEDLAQRHQRVVRVTFEPVEVEGGAAETLTADAAARMQVHVTLLRLHAPGHRVEPETIREQSYYTDPDLVARGMQPQYAVAWKQDDRLAARLKAEIEKRASDVDATSPR